MQEKKKGAKQALQNGAAVALLAMCISISFTGAAYAQTVTQGVRAYNIPAGDLATSLNLFSDQSGLQVLFDAALVKGFSASAVKGNLDAQQVLARLLKGSGLQAAYLNERTVILKRGASSPVSHSANPAAPSNVSGASKTPTQLSTVVVTGSRLPAAALQGPQAVQVYTAQAIKQSGQSTVADFLNTLPVVSTTVTEAGFQTNGGAETVRLRGLPVGSTLVLLDGRVVEGSGSNVAHGSPFDLNTIPIAAIERIEVVPEAASAVYGSDAIGGVVNIILRKDFDGGQLDVNTGAPTEGGYRDTTVSFAFGKKFDQGGISVIGSYQTRGALLASDRAITANQDYSRFGGPDNRTTACQPGNVYSVDGSNLPGLSSSFAGIPANSAGMLTPANFVATSGVLNKCSQQALDGATLLPATHRGNVLINGDYHLTDTTQAFLQIMYSQVEQEPAFPPNSVTQFPVPANNPYNPFKVPVLVDYSFNSEGPTQSANGTQYFSRLLAGLKGRWADRWDWEVAAWQSYDHSALHETAFNPGALANALASTDPAQSINLFSSGVPASSAVLNQIEYPSPEDTFSKLQTVNAFVRGSLFDLPSGSVDVVIGGEYDHAQQSLYAPGEGVLTADAFSRTIRSVFGEARVPLWAAGDDSGVGDRLAATFAARYDRYSDFGGKLTPEEGLEFRPTDTLLFRASYGKAFKAPDLQAVYGSQQVFNGVALPPDPLRGGQIESAAVIFGGNPHIKPQTGTSRTVGVVWSSKAVPNLEISLTNFRVLENDRIVQPMPFAIVQDPSAFPASLITRAAPTPQDMAQGFAGQIQSVNASYLNFGALLVEGYDLDANYKFDTSIGTFSPSLAVTEIYKYVSATPGTPLQNRLGFASDDAFATRWKGTVSMGWTQGPWSATVAGRYLSHYEDYDLARTLGDYWLFDASLRYNFGKAFGSKDPLLGNAYASVSVVNAFDRQPQYSNLFGAGYDPNQWDIRGRFVSLSVGTRW